MSVFERRIFLVIGVNSERRDFLKSLALEHFSGFTIYESIDASDGSLKFDNAPPAVVILDEPLAKMTSARFIDLYLMKKKAERTAFVVVGPAPEYSQFADEVVTHQVQYIEDIQDTIKVLKALTNGLNFASRDSDPEFSLRFLVPGDRLLAEGEVGETVFILKSGQMKAYVTVDNREVILGHIVAGDFVGEMAYINGEPRSATVVAEANCELVEIPSGYLDNLLVRKPAWSRALVKTLSKRLKSVNSRMGQPA